MYTYTVVGFGLRPKNGFLIQDLGRKTHTKSVGNVLKLEALMHDNKLLTAIKYI